MAGHLHQRLPGQQVQSLRQSRCLSTGCPHSGCNQEAEMYPLLKVTFTKPAYHPKMEPQGVVAVNGVDIVAIKAPSPFEDVDVFWAPAGDDSTQAERMGISKQQVSCSFEEKAAANSRPGVDTSMWCK
eukprot:7428404-Karenia_brevis.AAC.1